jgi:hypothetical protein
VSELAEIGRHAVELVSGGKYTPPTAVVEAVRGKGLNFEKISRVCTLTNLALLERDKKHHKASGGMVWQSRWPTAKPEDVMSALGGGIPVIEEVKTSAPSLPSTMESLRKLSGARSRQVREFAAPPRTKVSSPDDEVDEFDLQNMVMDGVEAVDHAQTKLSGAGFWLEQARTDVVMHIRRSMEKQSHTLGEALLVVQSSCTPAAFTEMFDSTLADFGIAPDDVLGQTLNEDGTKNVEKISRAKDLLKISQAAVDAFFKAPVVNPDSPLAKASAEYSKAFEAEAVLAGVADHLTDQVRDMAQQVRHLG